MTIGSRFPHVLKALFVLWAVFAFAGNAQADPVSWTDFISFDPNLYFAPGGYSSYSYTHDITDAGFTPGSDLLTSFDLRIGLYDDQQSDSAEWAFINLPGLLADTVVEVSFTDIEVGVSLAALITLNLTGQLDVTINRLYGDFYLANSGLTGFGTSFGALGDDGPVSAPEPNSLLLLGTGLIGLAAVRLRGRRTQ